MKTLKPFHVFLFVLSVMLLLALTSFLFPEKGIQLFGLDLRFKSLHSYYEIDSLEPKAIDVEQLLAARDSALDEKSTTLDSIHVNREESITSIQFKAQNSQSLHSFFEAMEALSNGGGNVHVLHYGDSQIEGDRMTNILRGALQERFGGRGPGLISPVPLVAHSAVVQTWSSNWSRYTAYGYNDQKAMHAKFGVMGAFGRYGQSNGVDTLKAWIEMRTSGMAKKTAKYFDQIVVYAGNSSSDIQVSLSIGDSLLETKTINGGGEVSRLVFQAKSSGASYRLDFSGLDSPDVYGISLESSSGVIVDNIAWRGSSGTIFKKINSSEMAQHMRWLNTELVILQFGGNSVPGLTSKQSAIDFGNYFKSQIQHVKKLVPGASIIVIGPSDMSTSIDGEFRSWPYIEDVRNAMRDAAFAEDCGFWDMYSVMGGRNSMVSWVEQNYAGKDYTHFTPNGSRKMAEIFSKALLQEYEAWKMARSAKS